MTRRRIAVVCAGITAKFLVLGFLLGIFGILWAVLAPPGAPAGMRSVTCRRCNKRQNIPGPRAGAGPAAVVAREAGDHRGPLSTAADPWP
jgi:hypothetical protein